jgi:hypothetical protein
MKNYFKIYVLAVSLLTAFMLIGCSESKNGEKVSQKNEGTVAEKVSETTADNNNEATKENVGSVGEASIDDSTENSDFDADAVANGIEVTSYTYKAYSRYYLILVLKNTVNDCALNVSVDLLDGNDQIVGTEEEEVDAFAKDTEVALIFDSNQKFSKFKWEFEPEACEYYNPVVQNLKCDVSIAKDKAIISVENTGNEPAEYVEYTALFFKGDKIVDTNWGYVGGSDKIEPGKTKKEETNCYEKFDSVKVYLDGRSESDW